MAIRFTEATPDPAPKVRNPAFRKPLASKRHLTIEARKPWLALEMSRRTWFRQGKPEAPN